MKHEHPELGHNVWQTTYEDLKGAKWLLAHRRPLHPRALRFKTPSTRWGDDAWLHVRELAASDGWGEVIARIDERHTIDRRRPTGSRRSRSIATRTASTTRPR